MANLDALFEAQIGVEATDAWGTTVNPSVKLMGVEELTIKPEVTSEIENELRGTLQPGYRTHVRKKGGSATLSGLLEIDDFPYLMSNLGGSSAGATDAAGNYTWTLTAPTEDTDTAKAASWTLCKTDRSNTYSLAGATVNNLTIEGESGGPLTYTAEFMGKSTTTDVHGALDDRVTRVAMGHMGVLSINAGSDSVGTTPVSDVAYSFSLNLETNRKFLTHIGNLNPSSFREGKWGGSLSLSIETSATTFGYLDAILATTNASVEKNVELEFTAATDSILTLQFGGVILEAPELYSDEDGITTLDFELQALKTSGMDSFFVATVYSTLATL